jgi:cyanate permease
VIWLSVARNARHVVSSTKMSIIRILSHLIRVSTIRIIFGEGLLAFCTSHGLTNWLPNLFENRGMSAAEAGFMASIPMFTGIISVLLISSLTPSRLRGEMVSIMALANVLTILLLVLTCGAFRITGLIVFGIAGFAILPLFMLMLMDTPEVEANTIGLGSGVFFAIGEIGGFSGP